MTLELIVGILALIVAIISAMGTVAGLTDDGRARLTRWTKTAASKTYRVCHGLFLVASLANGVVGVVLFGLGPDLPTRKDILLLLLFLLNIAIGAYGIYLKLDRYATARSQPALKP